MFVVILRNITNKIANYMNFEQILKATAFGTSLQEVLVFCLKTAVIYLIVRIITALVKFFFRRSMHRQGRIVLDETNISFVRRFIVTCVYILGVAAFLSLIPGMEKVTNSILASAGILAMAVGLASQEALSNIVGGLFIIFARPFKVGDFIQVDNMVIGTVLEITLRHTVIRNAENRIILIPNSVINSSTIINSTFGDPSTCSFIEVGVSYNTNLDHAMQIMREEVMKHPSLIDFRSETDKQNGVPQVIVRVMELGNSAITLRAWAWAATSGDAFAMKCDLLKAIKERFDQEGIEIPYPYYNVITSNGKA